MTAPILFTTGTPHGEWATWVRPMLLGSEHGARLCAPSLPAWLGSLAAAEGGVRLPLSTSQRAGLDSLAPAPESSAPWGGVDPRAAWVLAELLRRFPQAQALVIIEDPAIALARAFVDGKITEPTHWLDSWREGARLLLQQAQRDPTRCLLVDSAEAQRHPEALAAALSERFGIEIPASTLPQPPSNVEPLAASLAAMLTFQDAGTQAVLFELRASCALLSAEDPGSMLPPSGPEIDGESTIRRLQILLAAERALPQITANAEQTIQQARLDAEEAFRQSTADNSATESQAALLNEEIASLKTALSEREAAVDRLRSEAQQQDDSAASALAAAISNSDKLRAEVRQFTDERDKAVASAQQRQLELHNARRELESSRKESDLLSLQLDQANEELDVLHRECTALQAAVDNAAPIAAGACLQIGKVIRGLERDTPPHREATFVLRDVKADEREMREIVVRLVEHNGHPGLSIFGAPGAQLLRSWRETGKEAEYPYELIVPSDVQSTSLLHAMDSADWLLLQALIARLERELKTETSASTSAWQDVARRLREELQELPKRFRFKSVAQQPTPGVGGDAMTLRFTGANCGVRSLQRLNVAWQSSGERAGLILLNDGESALAFSSWPVDDQGSPLAALRLPLGVDVPMQIKHDAWAALAVPDREFVLAMLEAWPATMSQVASDALPAERSLLAQAREAIDWMSPEQIAADAGPRPHWLRRLARRGRGLSARTA